MDRATRDKFVITTQKDLTSGNACLETPPRVFLKIQEDFGPFDIDLTADVTRHLLYVWFGPGSPYGEDALTVQWLLHGNMGYSNPPYGPFVKRILKKAKEEAAKGFASTFLLPVRMGTTFHEQVIYGATELHFCNKRITFWENGAPKLTKMKDGSMEVTTALFDSMIVRYKPGIRFSPPRVFSWKVPKHV